MRHSTKRANPLSLLQRRCRRLLVEQLQTRESPTDVLGAAVSALGSGLILFEPSLKADQVQRDSHVFSVDADWAISDHPESAAPPVFDSLAFGYSASSADNQDYRSPSAEPVTFEQTWDTLSLDLFADPLGRQQKPATASAFPHAPQLDSLEGLGGGGNGGGAIEIGASGVSGTGGSASGGQEDVPHSSITGDFPSTPLGPPEAAAAQGNDNPSPGEIAFASVLPGLVRRVPLPTTPVRIPPRRPIIRTGAPGGVGFGTAGTVESSKAGSVAFASGPGTSNYWFTTGEAWVNGNTVTLGDANRGEGATDQPEALHVATVLLQPADSYTLTFGFDLSTYDSYNDAFGYWDSFSVSLTNQPYPDVITADPVIENPAAGFGFVWGGESYPVLETYAGTRTVTLPGNPTGNNYLNVMLDTDTPPSRDTAFPSWGTFTFTSLPATLPLPIPPRSPPGVGGCDTREILRAAQRAMGGNPGGNNFSRNPIRYFDGTVRLASTDLESPGFGTEWGHTRSWTNGAGYASTTDNGSGWVTSQLPYLLPAYGQYTSEAGDRLPPVLALVSSGTDARYFDNYNNQYVPRFFAQDTLTHDFNASEFILADTTGNRIRFHNFSTTLPTKQRGQLKSFTDAAGNVTTLTRGADGKVTKSERMSGTPTITESFRYTYWPIGDPNVGLIKDVTLERQVAGGNPFVVRKVEYTYYGASEATGNLGDLKTAKVSDGVTVLDTKYYRYYKPAEANGYEHALKYVLEPESYARLAAVTDPLTASDAQVEVYADFQFKYDSQKRVIEEKVLGAGCSSSTGGIGTFTFTYHPQSTFLDGYNSWKYKTEETLPDGNKNFVYSNFAGEVMLKVFRDVSTVPAQDWREFYEYDTLGRVVLHAMPSAVTGHDETKEDLLNKQGSDYQHIANAAGLLMFTDYYATTTTAAPAVTAALAAGGNLTVGTTYYYVITTLTSSGESVRSNEVSVMPTAGQQTAALSWNAVTGATGYKVYRGTVAGEENTLVTTTIATATSFNDNGGSISSQTPPVNGYLKQTKLQRGELGTPVVQRSAQFFARTAGGSTIHPIGNETVYRNTSGPGETTSYSYTWHGTSTQVATVTVTHPVVSTANNGPGTADVETMSYDTFGRMTQTVDAGGFTHTWQYDHATGAVTRSAVDTAGLNLVTQIEVDRLGRPTKVTDPRENVTYTVYKDTAYETRVYPGWQAGPPASTTGPIVVTREHRPAAGSGSVLQYVDDGGAGFSATTGFVEATGQGYLGDVRYAAAGTGSESATWTFSSLPTGTYRVSATWTTHVNRATDSPFTVQDGSTPLTTILVNQELAPADFSDVGVGWKNLGDFTVTTGSLNVKLTNLANEFVIADAIRIERQSGLYFEVLTSSVAPNVTGGKPDGTESLTVANTLQTLSRQYTNSAGQLVHSDRYVNLTGLTYSTHPVLGGAVEPTHYSRTVSTYDSRGRLSRVKSPTGTIEQTVYDGLGRALSSWVGTDDTGATHANPAGSGVPNNMKQITLNIYDGTAALPDVSGVGDGNLTRFKQFPDTIAANVRVTDNFYDWRNRLVASKAGVQTSEGPDTQRPISYYELDNLGRITAVERYDGDTVSIVDTTPADGVPDKPSAGLLRARGTMEYDERGRVWRSKVFHVEPTNGAVSANSLTTKNWYDRRGNLIKTVPPGGAVMKNQYDGAGRMTKTFHTDAGGDGETSWTDAGNVTGDNVLEQTDYLYDKNSNVIQVTVRQRFHDETMTGELQSATTRPYARRSYVANYYDAADRPTHAVNVGTNGGSDFTRDLTPPTTGSDTLLLTKYAYNAAGWLETLTDPRGTLQKTFYDHAGRRVKLIEAYTGDGVPTSNTNRTTEFTYDGMDHVVTLKAVLPGSAFQTTQYVYGVTTTGTDPSDINSNDVIKEVRYPKKDDGTASTLPEDIEKLGYNALGQVKLRRDRNNSKHEYAFDVLGRQTADKVSELGGGVDNTVRRLETAYDSAGLPFKFTSYSDPVVGMGTITRNQVQRTYNGLGQLTIEYQANSGAVNTSTTPRVAYSYSFETGTPNHSRLKSIVYPNLRQLDYLYATGLDDTISRLTEVKEGATTLEALTYLGLGTVVKRAHPQPGVDLTYILASGTGEAGDKYGGLDRFGRIKDQRWLKNAGSVDLDRFGYGYDRNSNRLYRDNQVSGGDTFDELYHANGPAAGYDQLNQLTEFRRGALSDTDADNIPDTVATASRWQSWNLDAQGNWNSITTTGSTVNRTHNKQNQLTEVASLPLMFDGNGNMTQDDGGLKYFYDAWNRVVEVKNSVDVSLGTHRYDALNRRVKEGIGTGSAKDLYYSSSWQVLEEREPGGSAAKAHYVWSPVYVDALILRDRDTDATPGFDETVYVLQDANFNVTALVSTSGTVVERYVYDPYGSVMVLDVNWQAQSPSVYNGKYLHQGGRFDATSGLYHFRNREYSPTLGRWVQRDPIEFAGGDTNLYAYVHNGPTNAVDPSGLLPEWLENIGSGAVDILRGFFVDAPVGAFNLIRDIHSSQSFGIGYVTHLVGLTDAPRLPQLHSGVTQGFVNAYVEGTPGAWGSYIGSLVPFVNSLISAINGDNQTARRQLGASFWAIVPIPFLRGGRCGAPQAAPLGAARNLAVPRLAAGAVGQMFRAIIEHMRNYARSNLRPNQYELANVFNQMARQLHEAHPGWSASAAVLSDGTIVFVGENVSNVFAIRTNGTMLQSNPAIPPLRVGRTGIQLDYEAMRGID